MNHLAINISKFLASLLLVLSSINFIMFMIMKTILLGNEIIINNCMFIILFIVGL